MKKVTAEHEIACSPETFWKLFFDKAFNDELYLKVLECDRFEILEQSATSRRLKVSPKVNVPGALKKLMGDGFSYEEVGSFDEGASTWSYEVLPDTLKKKLTNKGTVRCVPAGDGKCKRLDAMTIEAKVFGIGGMIESTTENQVRDAWDKASSFTSEWVAKNG
ncbi:MAG: DUF2505 domain-containing protein [Deltaproteobacteria bacterium]|nr:DUF2505 domain-containing protein [Deltaproteobacteria bacterium]